MKKKKINIHAGHLPDGKVGCGAVGYMKESTESRKVVKELKKLLKKNYIVYDCTVNNGKSQNDCLTKIVKKCNKHIVDLDISIHFNAYKKDKKDGKIKGTEVLVYSKYTEPKKAPTEVLRQMEKIGFTSRGIKYRNDLYYLRETKNPAMLIEICFVDDVDDVNLYKKVDVAKAIYKAIEKVV